MDLAEINNIVIKNSNIICKMRPLGYDTIAKIIHTTNIIIATNCRVTEAVAGSSSAGKLKFTSITYCAREGLVCMHMCSVGIIS